MANSYRNGLALSLAARSVSIGTSLVVIWAFNLAGRDVYGVYALAGSWFAIFTVIGCYGLDQLVLYRQSRNRDGSGLALLAASLGKGWRISLVLSVIFLVFGVVQTGGSVFTVDGLIYAAFAVMLPAMVSTLVFSAWHQALQDYYRALLVPRTTDLLRVVFIILLGLFLPDVGFYLLVIVASAWLPYALYRIDIGSLPAGPVEIDPPGRKYAQQMLVVRLMRSSVDNIDIIMVGLITSPALTAAYALGSRIASFALLGNQLLGQVTLPRIGSMLGRGDFGGMMSEFDRHRWLSLLVALMISILIMLFGEEVLDMFGSYDDAIPVLYTLLGTHILVCSFGPVGNALKMGGHASRLLSSVWVLLLLLFISNLVLVPVFGIVGAALGTLLSLLLTNLLNWWQCYRVFGVWTTGPVEFLVMLAGCTGIVLFVSGTQAGGFSLTGGATLIALFKGLQGGQKMTEPESSRD